MKLTIIVLLWVTIGFLAGCESLVIRDDDNIAVSTGKVFTRTLAGIGTLGMSEVGIAQIKQDEEGRPRIVTSGSRNRALLSSQGQLKVIVWGNDSIVLGQVTDFFQQHGDILIDRGRVRSVADQNTQWTYTGDDAGELVKVGKQIGADIIVFAELAGASETHNQVINRPGLIAPVGGMLVSTPPTSQTVSQQLHHLRVNVRSIDVKDGAMRWNGSAAFDKPISNPAVGIGMLTDAAILRAVCPTDRKYRWVEQAPWRKAGCLPDN
jgi:hypothetical protein